MINDISLFQLFKVFAKIGAFTIGGGYAMIPFIEDEVVRKRNWIDSRDFVDIIAVSQSAPGILAVNVAIFIGYKLRGFIGSLFSTLGAILFPFTIILIIAISFSGFKENTYVESAFKGIRPAVVALIATPIFSLAKSADINTKNIWIPLISVILIFCYSVSPMWIIIGAGVLGYMYGLMSEKKK